MGVVLYNLFLFAYSVGIRFVAFVNPKAKKWLAGRKNIFTSISSQLKIRCSKVIWMHCASLGEFEQGRPLLEKLRINNEELIIVLTFFSPSGYEVMKDYKGADYIFYLPMDSPGNAAKFIELIKPTLVLWVKYEFWFYYLTELKKKNVPTILVSAIFRKSHPFFKWYGSIWRKMLNSFTHIFIQDESSKKLLSTINMNKNISVNGDTRFDRVIAIADNFIPVREIEEFVGDTKVIVAGSTWTEDDKGLNHYVNTHPAISFIIVPHEIIQERLNECLKLYKNAILYSQWKTIYKNWEGEYIHSPISHINCLIIDNIGMLSRLYHYATVCYVGGGFGKDGLHNVLEAAVYGKPVIFGPIYEKFNEAVALVESGGGISITGPLKLEEALNRLVNDEEEIKKRGNRARDFVYANAGASQRIVDFIQEKRLLTS